MVERLVDAMKRAGREPPGRNGRHKARGRKAAPEAPADRAPTQAEYLLQLAGGQGYFHAADGRAYVTVAAGEGDERRETLPVRGKDFRSWLCRRYYRGTGKAPSVKTLQDVLGVLEARARYDGPRQEVYCRLGAAGPEQICLDLCDDLFRSVVITAKGWRLVDVPPVPFRRVRGALPLPAPARKKGGLDELRTFLNIQDEDWFLLVAWLVQALRPCGPYPILCLHGEQGSAKSTTARVVRALIDPSCAPLRAEPRDERDLIIGAGNSWVVALDNLSHLEPWLSDALCRLSTGGGFATRELFSDTDEVIIDAQRPVILTGIEDLASRADLMDRALVLLLPPIAEEKRQTERDFWRRFEEARPRILGALLDAVAGALAGLPHVRLQKLPRMADFAAWVTAAEKTLGWKEDRFLEAYDGNRAAANDLTLEAAPLVEPLRLLLAEEGGRVQGTAKQLLDRLNGKVGDKPPRYWPATPRGLSGILRRLAPNLRKAGIETTFERTGSQGRLITVRDAGQARAAPDAAGRQPGDEPDEWPPAGEESF